MPNLISSDSTLRLASLQILAAAAPGTALAPKSEENITSLREIYNLCVQIEFSEMTLRNVRERTTNISRLTRSISALPVALPKFVLKGIVTYLVAQFKVNFRPVYPEAIAALSALTEKYKEEVWEIVWTELERTNNAKEAVTLDLDAKHPDWAEEQGSNEDRAEKDEEEAEFRCPNLEKSKVVFSRVWGKRSQEEKLDQQEIGVCPYGELVYLKDKADFIIRSKSRMINSMCLTMSLNCSLHLLRFHLLPKSTPVSSSL